MIQILTSLEKRRLLFLPMKVSLKVQDIQNNQELLKEYIKDYFNIHKENMFENNNN